MMMRCLGRRSRSCCPCTFALLALLVASPPAAGLLVAHQLQHQHQHQYGSHHHNRNHHHHHVVVVVARQHCSQGRAAPLHQRLRQPQPLYVQQQEQEETSSTGSSDANGNDDNNIQVNPLVASVKVSKTVEIFSLVKQMQSQGTTTDVTSLCVGEPDFSPPQCVLRAIVNAVQEGGDNTRYTAVTGTAALRTAIAKDLRKRKGLLYHPNTDIVVTNGAKQAVFQAVMAVVAKDDVVLIPTPYWPSYPEMATLVGGIPKFIETRAEDGFLLTPHALQEALDEHGERAKLLILCNPSNPTGGVHNAKRLEELARVLEGYPRVAILADEIYERLVYQNDADDNDNDGDPCPSFASMPRMLDRTLTINGFSKAYAMTGLRLGYVATAHSKLAHAITTIQSQITSCASSLSQAAGVAALHIMAGSQDEEYLQQQLQLLKAKRDFVLDELRTMRGVEVAVPPMGAFYVLPNVSGFFDGDDTKLCLELLQQKKLALVPGSSFGAPGTVRISYATSMEELQVAMDKLREFLDEQDLKQ